MSNALVEMLRTYGFIGREKPLSRKEAAKILHTSVREVQALSEASRNAGVPNEIVCYTSAGKKKGLFLASSSDEILAMKLKVTREAKARLIQRKGLQKALLAVQPNHLWPTPPTKLIQSEIFPTEKK